MRSFTVDLKDVTVKPVEDDLSRYLENQVAGMNVGHWTKDGPFLTIHQDGVDLFMYFVCHSFAALRSLVDSIFN